MLIRRADAVTEAGGMPDEEVFAAMGRYNEEMINAGVMLQGEGLHPSAKGARVKVSKKGPTVTDGPFTESKELIAGFSMIQVNSLEEAIEWAKRWPAIDSGAEIEIRQVYEMEDFGESFTPELREQEVRLREQAAKNR
jgi:hypothetical protein